MGSSFVLPNDYYNSNHGVDWRLCLIVCFVQAPVLCGQLNTIVVSLTLSIINGVLQRHTFMMAVAFMMQTTIVIAIDQPTTWVQALGIT